MFALTLLLATSAAQIPTGAPSAALPFVHKEELFSAQSFDTGWKPSSGPVQVRMQVDVGSGFDALASGSAHLNWSPIRQLWAEGNVLGGRLRMNAGVEVKTRLKLALSLPGGLNYNWEGPIPSAPNFDFRFADQQLFTPFLLEGQNPRTVKVSDSIQQTKLYSVPLTESIIPIPGVPTTPPTRSTRDRMAVEPKTFLSASPTGTRPVALRTR